MWERVCKRERTVCVEGGDESVRGVWHMLLLLLLLLLLLHEMISLHLT